MAKHGIVALTRAFLVSEPKMSDSEGIKCYAIAPFFADTNLVRSIFESDPETVKNTGVENMEDLSKKVKMRILTVNEVGDAMIKSLQYDKVQRPKSGKITHSLEKYL